MSARYKYTLLDLTGLLDGLGIPFFLSHGTALGAVRDGGFVPDLDDLDIGFRAEEFVPAAPDLCRELVLEGYELMTLTLPFSRCWAIKARRDGVSVDLVSFVRWECQVHGDDGRFCPSQSNDYVGWYPRGMIEEQETVRVFGREFNVPRADYFQHEYGDGWAEPSLLHAYYPGSSARVDGFMQTRGVSASILDHLCRVRS